MANCLSKLKFYDTIRKNVILVEYKKKFETDKKRVITIQKNFDVNQKYNHKHPLYKMSHFQRDDFSSYFLIRDSLKSDEASTNENLSLDIEEKLDTSLKSNCLSS